LASAFFGARYYTAPRLELCYQKWKTSGKYVSKELSTDTSEKKSEHQEETEFISPLAKYYNIYHPAWYNNLKRLSTEGVACKEEIPPEDQRRAWMVVRHVLVNHYRDRMIDYEQYNEILYPHNVEALPADFKPQWEDETFE
jgi:hypothetical protein